MELGSAQDGLTKIEGRSVSFGPPFAKPRRIRTYLVLFALAFVLPLLTVSVVALDRMAAIEEAQIENRVPQIARNLTVAVEQELDRALITLETLATSSELRNGDLRGFHHQAVRALKSTKAAIVLVDRTYQQLVDTLKEFGAPLPPTSDPVTAQRVFDTKRPQISNLFKGSISGRPVFNVETPVFGTDGEVEFVLIMSFPAAHMSELLSQVNLSPDWIAGITDGNGIVLARSERHDQFVGTALPEALFAQTRSEKGVYSAVNVKGEPILRATTRSEKSGWYVSATVPLSLVKEPRFRGYYFAALLLATAIVVGWSCAFYFARLMTIPLDEATRAAAALGQGSHVEAKRTALVEANLLLETMASASLELSARAEHADFLVHELAHRAKNQLAIVKGMASQTSRQSTDVGDFVFQFNRRIQGLSQSQDLLLRQNWRGAWMNELANVHVDLFGVRDRVTIEGPRVFLNAAAVQNIGFALHELATNAFKHGSLSTPQGRVSITWSLADDGFELVWSEKGGSTGGDRSRRGFGHRVITDLVPRALKGKADLDFIGSGIRWRLRMPKENILQDESHRSAFENRTIDGHMKC